MVRHHWVRVGVRPHLMGDSGFTSVPEAKFLCRAVYLFHVFFTIRRVLKDMGCPLPNSKDWNPLNNPINMAQYERICNKFGISKNTSWVLHGLGNWGLGRMRERASGEGRGDAYLTSETFNPNFHYFGQVPTSGETHIDHITQIIGNGMAENGWTQFIIQYSDTLSSAGLERINQSIRTYFWCILVAQSETLKPLMGIEGEARGARQRFVDLVEDAGIEKGGPEFSGATGFGGTPTMSYELALQHARSKLDFSVSGGLHLIPSDMNLYDLTGKGRNDYTNE
jgi:hypothetical protein